MKPSGMGSLFSSSTPQHDEIHLWLSESKNIETLVNWLYPGIKAKYITHKDITKVTISPTIKQEYPIFGYNKFLIGKVDAMIGLKMRIHHREPYDIIDRLCDDIGNDSLRVNL